MLLTKRRDLHETELNWTIDLLKLASEASQENFEKNCIFNHKIWANIEIRTFAMPKSGGGGAQTHLCPPPPTFESGEARGPPPPAPPPPPFSYALASPWRCDVSGGVSVSSLVFFFYFLMPGMGAFVILSQISFFFSVVQYWDQLVPP